MRNPNLVFAVAGALALCGVAFGLYKIQEFKAPAKSAPPRFIHTSVESGLYLIRDNQTGKEYLSRFQGGFVEVEPTKKP